MHLLTIRIISVMASLCAGLFMAVSAQANFQIIENFDNLTLGNIDGQNGWRATPGSGFVVIDPTDFNNQVIKVITESGNLYKPAKIKQGTMRMVFLRFRFEKHCEFSFGFSSEPMPYMHEHFGPELGMASATASDPANEFRVANGFLSIGIYDGLKTIVPGTWYNIWILVNNASNTYQVWMTSGYGSSAQAIDRLVNSAKESLFRFRTLTDKDLIMFFIKTACGASPVDGQFYLDDIFLEDTGDINLNNPLPPRIMPPLIMLLLRNE